MSREILFRGKRTDANEWIEGNYITDEQNPSKAYIGYLFGVDDDGAVHDTDIVEVDPETVCQYTGYKDDTGKRIFEGDIVGFEDMTSTESGYSEMSCCGQVGYDEEEACFYVTDRLSAESWEVLGECHIIGNIFDNPELLNQ